MWIVYACGSALFAGLTAILAKCGIKKTDSDVATAIRTIVVLLFSWLMVGIGKVLNDVQFYFPEPHQPWQRGTNENTNGLLREYFPKKQDLTEIKPSLIRDKTLILNQRPRKCLNWKSPFEVYFDISLHLT